MTSTTTSQHQIPLPLAKFTRVGNFNFEPCHFYRHFDAHGVPYNISVATMDYTNFFDKRDVIGVVPSAVNGKIANMVVFNKPYFCKGKNLPIRSRY